MLNATWSDGDSDCSKEDDTNVVGFPSISDGVGEEGSASPSKNDVGVSEGVMMLT